MKELCKDVDDSSVQILLQQYDFNIDHTVQAILDGKIVCCLWFNAQLKY